MTIPGPSAKEFGTALGMNHDCFEAKWIYASYMEMIFPVIYASNYDKENKAVWAATSRS